MYLKTRSGRFNGKLFCAGILTLLIGLCLPGFSQTIDQALVGPIFGNSYFPASGKINVRLQSHWFTGNDYFDHAGARQTLFPEELFSTGQVNITTHTLVLNYGLEDGAGLRLSLPYQAYFQLHTTPAIGLDGSDEIKTSGLTGIGDIALDLWSQSPFKDQERGYLFGRVLVPSGITEYDLKEDEVGATGQGAFALAGGFGGDYMGLKPYGIFMSTEADYQYNFPHDIDSEDTTVSRQAGNEIHGHLRISYPFITLFKTSASSLDFGIGSEFRYRIQKSESIEEELVEKTGSRLASQSLTLGFSYRNKNIGNLSVYVDQAFPLSGVNAMIDQGPSLHLKYSRNWVPSSSKRIKVKQGLSMNSRSLPAKKSTRPAKKKTKSKSPTKAAPVKIKPAVQSEVATPEPQPELRIQNSELDNLPMDVEEAALTLKPVALSPPAIEVAAVTPEQETPEVEVALPVSLIKYETRKPFKKDKLYNPSESLPLFKVERSRIYPLGAVISAVDVNYRWTSGDSSRLTSAATVQEALNQANQELFIETQDSVGWQVYTGIPGFTHFPRKNISIFAKPNLAISVQGEDNIDMGESADFTGGVHYAINTKYGIGVEYQTISMLQTLPNDSTLYLRGVSMNLGNVALVGWYQLHEEKGYRDYLKFILQTAVGDSIQSGILGDKERSQHGFGVEYRHDRILGPASLGSAMLGIKLYSSGDYLFTSAEVPDFSVGFSGRRGHEVYGNIQYKQNTVGSSQIGVGSFAYSYGGNLDFRLLGNEVLDGDVMKKTNGFYLGFTPKMAFTFNLKSMRGASLTWGMGVRVPLVTQRYARTTDWEFSVSMNGRLIDMILHLIQVNSGFSDTDGKRN